MVLSLMSFTVFAQNNGGVKGKVVSRTTRAAIDGVKVTLTPGDVTTKTDASGNFVIENLAKGEYTLSFEAAEFEPLTLAVRVDKLIRDINNVILIPENVAPTMDDAIFAEFDTETLEDAQSLPSSLSASKDVFNNIASYKFSEMRFNVRGYDSQYSDVYMNGIQLNDAMTGYTPYSLWSDATRNQEVTSALNMGDMGIGGIAGTTNINTRPSQMRKGLRASVVNGNSMYRFRGMLTYASGLQDNGWSYAFSVSRRKLLCKRCVLQCLRIFCRCRKAIQFTTPLGIKHPGCSHRTWCTTSFYSGSLRLSRQQLLQSKLGLAEWKACQRTCAQLS